MRPLAAAFLLLAVSASAQPTFNDLKKKSGDVKEPRGVDVAEYKPPVTGCDEKQQASMEAAIAAARKKVDDCLDGFNHRIAAEIQKNFKKFTFSCHQETRAAGGNTDHELADDGSLKSAAISITMHSRLVQYSREARVFHEMIHAIDLPSRDRAAKKDRDGRLIISAERHASAGFPDPVYGCQFSCYPEGIGEDEGKQITRYNRLLNESGEGLKLPEGKKKVDDGGNQYAQIYGPTYAGLCETGKPVAPKSLVAKDRELNRPVCIAEKILNGCDAPDEACASAHPPKGELCERRCAVLRDPKAADEVIAMGGRLASALDDGGANLDPADKKVFSAAKKLIAACK